MKKKITSHSVFENIKAMGLVFGDIGTSPIYTLIVIFTLSTPTLQHVMGVLSLIFWTLLILVTVEYAWLAMSLSTKGEGGIIVLKEILASKVKKGRRSLFAVYLGYLGVSLLMGDGVITPAISILSAIFILSIYKSAQWRILVNNNCCDSNVCHYTLDCWNKKLQIAFRSLDIDIFLESYNQVYKLGNNIRGTALYLTKNLEKVPPYVVHCMLRTNIIYEENILYLFQHRIILMESM